MTSTAVTPEDLSSSRLAFRLTDCYGTMLPWPCLRFQDGKEAEMTLQSSVGKLIFGSYNIAKIDRSLRKDMIKRITLGDFTPTVYLLLGDVVPGDRTFSDGTFIEFFEYIQYKDNKLTPEQRSDRNAAMKQAYAVMELADRNLETTKTPPPVPRVSHGPDTLLQQQKEYRKPTDSTTDVVDHVQSEPRDEQVGGKPLPSPEDNDVHSPQNQSTPVSNTRIKPPIPSKSSTAIKKKKTFTLSDIPQWHEVSPLLVKQGYVFRDGYYAHRKQKIADNLFDFRRYLCAKGVQTYRSMSPSHQMLLSTWVRYTVCESLEHREYLRVSSAAMLHFVRRIGVVYKRAKNLDPDCYILPGYSEEQIQRGLGVFARSEELYQYLARFGFPDNLSWDDLTLTERLSLELAVADSLRVQDTFDFDESRSPFPAPEAVAEERIEGPKLSSKKIAMAYKSSPANTKRKSTVDTAGSTVQQHEPRSFTTPAKTTGNLGVSKTPGTTPRSQYKIIPFSKASIPNFVDVRPILEKHGYIFTKDHFCRPGMDPSTNQSAKLGLDYFQNVDSFRQDLCSRGLTSSHDEWDEDDKKILSRWIRYSVVKSLEFLVDEPKYFQASDRVLRSLALKLGVRVISVGPRGLKEARFVLPGYSEEQALQGIGCFLDPNGMFEYFSVHGIPHNLKWDQLDDVERLSFELAVADFVGTEACFEYYNDGKVTRFPEPAHDNYVDRVTDDSFHSSRKRASSPTISASPKKAKSSPRVISMCSSLTVTLPLSSSNVTVVSADSPTRKNTILVPDQYPTNELRLRACLEQLQLSSIDFHNLTLVPGSKFAENMAWVESALNKAVSDYELNDLDRPPSTMFIGGPPGIGKTAGVRLACYRATELAKSIPSLETPITIHINCSFLRSTSNPASLLAEKILDEMGSNTKAKDPVKYLKSKLQKSPLVFLVLDEIDLLVNEFRVDTKRIVGAEAALELVRELAERHEMGIVPIGVANSTANNRFARLQQLLKIEKVRFFSTYDAQDITAILEARVGSSIVASNVIKLIGKKVQERSGDARQAFDQLGNAILQRLQRLAPEDKTSVTEGPLVEMKDYIKVMQEESKRIEHIIDGFSPSYTAILCVCVALSKEDVKVTTIKHLRKFSMDCIVESHGPEHALRAEDFQIALDIIADTGLLNITRPKESCASNMSLSELAGVPVRLGIQLEDVEKVLAKSLQHGVYQKIRETARARRDELICLP